MEHLIAVSVARQRAPAAERAPAHGRPRRIRHARSTPSALSKEIIRATPREPRANGDPEIAVPLSEKLQPTLSRIEREMIKAALKTTTAGSTPPPERWGFRAKDCI